MPVLRTLTNFGSFQLYHFFQKYEFSEQFAKSRSIILIFNFNTIIFKFSRFEINFGIVSENFSDMTMPNMKNAELLNNVKLKNDLT